MRTAHTQKHKRAYIHLYIYTLVWLYIHTNILHISPLLCTCTLIHLHICLFVCLFICALIHLYIRTYIHNNVGIFGYLHIWLFGYPFTYTSIQLYIYTDNQLYICMGVHWKYLIP